MHAVDGHAFNVYRSLHVARRYDFQAQYSCGQGLDCTVTAHGMHCHGLHVRQDCMTAPTCFGLRYLPSVHSSALSAVITAVPAEPVKLEM